MFATTLGRLRLTALAEGLSYIILLGIAMPLKYAFGWPAAVRIFGTIHGALFILFVLTLAHAQHEKKWGTGFSILIFISSLIPLGAFWMDSRLKRLSSR